MPSALPPDDFSPTDHSEKALTLELDGVKRFSRRTPTSSRLGISKSLSCRDSSVSSAALNWFRQFWIYSGNVVSNYFGFSAMAREIHLIGAAMLRRD
jgi:hypothetical protein